ncbi:MAG TPA: hypothetical protein VIQ51_10675 [Chryseosolibacter sp.]
MTKIIHITPRKIANTLCVVIFCLFVVNMAIIYLHFVQGHEHLKGFVRGFYFDAEANFPSLYSALAIVLCSVLLWLIGSNHEEKLKNRALYWKFLSLVFAFLALDEFAGLHEDLAKPVKSLIDQSSIQSDYLHFAWFIPYSIATLVLGIIYVRFFFKLPPRTRQLFFLSALLFLSGAVGMEMVGGKYWASQNWAPDLSQKVNFTYALIITLEELLEMLGIVIFAYALADYFFKNREETILFRFSNPQKQDFEHRTHDWQRSEPSKTPQETDL